MGRRTYLAKKLFLALKYEVPTKKFHLRNEYLINSTGLHLNALLYLC